MKYEVPCIEFVRFEFKNILADASDFLGGEEAGGGLNGEENGDDMYDPFA